MLNGDDLDINNSFSALGENSGRLYLDELNPHSMNSIPLSPINPASHFSPAFTVSDEDSTSQILSLNRDLVTSGFRPLPVETSSDGSHIVVNEVDSVLKLTRRLYDTMKKSQEAVEAEQDKSARIKNDNKMIYQRTERLKREIMEKDRLIENLRFQLENADRRSREELGDRRKLELELKRVRLINKPGNVQHHQHYIHCEHQDNSSKEPCHICKHKSPNSMRSTSASPRRPQAQKSRSRSSTGSEDALNASFNVAPHSAPLANTTLVVNLVVNPDELRNQPSGISHSVPITELDAQPDDTTNSSTILESNTQTLPVTPLKKPWQKHVSPRARPTSPVTRSTESSRSKITSTPVSSTAPTIRRTTTSPSNAKPTKPPAKKNSPIKSKPKLSLQAESGKSNEQGNTQDNLDEDSLVTLLEEQSRLFGALISESPSAGLYANHPSLLIESTPSSPVSTLSTDILFPMATRQYDEEFVPKDPSKQYVEAMAAIQAFDEATAVGVSGEFTVLPPSIKKKLKQQLEFIREKWLEVEKEREALMAAAVKIGKDRDELKLEQERFEEEKRRYKTDKVVEFLDTMI